MTRRFAAGLLTALLLVGFVAAGCGVDVQSEPVPLTGIPTAPVPVPTVTQHPDPPPTSETPAPTMPTAVPTATPTPR